MKQDIEHQNALDEFYQNLPYNAFASSVSGELRPSQWESAILQMFNGMQLYAKLHEERFEEEIGYDYVLGTENSLRRIIMKFKTEIELTSSGKWVLVISPDDPSAENFLVKLHSTDFEVTSLGATLRIEANTYETFNRN